MSYQLEQARIEYQKLQDKYDEVCYMLEDAIRRGALAEKLLGGCADALEASLSGRDELIAAARRFADRKP